jgi:hypothetical protein
LFLTGRSLLVFPGLFFSVFAARLQRINKLAASDLVFSPFYISPNPARL